MGMLFRNTELMLVLLLVCFDEYHIFKADYQICFTFEECNGKKLK